MLFIALPQPDDMIGEVGYELSRCESLEPGLTQNDVKPLKVELMALDLGAIC